MKRDYPGVDLVRFGAALLVTAYHLTFWWWLPDNGLDPSGEMWRRTAAVHSISQWGWVGVNIFFVLSGFVIAFTAEGKTAVQFLKNRALRLYPAAWLCATLTLVISRWGDAGVAGDYVRSLTLFPIGPWIDGAYWSLAVELVFYLLIAVVLALKVDLTKLATGLSAVGCMFPLISIANFMTGERLQPIVELLNHFPVLVSLLLGYAPFFGLGMLTWSLSKADHKRIHKWLWGATLVACILQVLKGGKSLLGHDGTSSLTMVWPALIWLFATSIIAANVRWHDHFSSKLAHVRDRLRILGLMTYPLYLIHGEIGRDVALRLEGFMSPPLAVGFAILVVILLSWLLLKLEPLPRSWLRRLLWQKEAVQAGGLIAGAAT